MAVGRIFASLLVLFGVRYSACNSLPCDFIDSVNITDGVRLANGTINHNGILYSPTYYREIDYDYEDFATRKYVPPYIRGCLCAVRICVRLCCRDNEHLAIGCTKADMVFPIRANVSVNATREMIDLRESPNYGFLHGKPCAQVYELLPQDSPHDEWTIARVSDRHSVTLLVTFNHPSHPNSTAHSFV